MSLQITKRRIQRLGGSSLIITLPKTWIRKYGLQPGDEVLVVDEGSYLRILPNTAGMEESLRTLRVEKFNSHISLARLAECAFTKGYNAVEVPVSKSNMDLILEMLDEAERSEVTSNISLQYDKVVIRLIDTGATPSLVLKNLRLYMLSTLEHIAAGDVDFASVEESTRKLEYSVKELYRLMRKKGVTACEEAPLDPYSLGILSSVISSFASTIEALAGEREEVRKEAADILMPIVVSGIGGILNSSVKRIREARALIRGAEETLSGIVSGPTRLVLKLFLDSFNQLLEHALCNIIEKMEAKK